MAQQNSINKYSEKLDLGSDAANATLSHPLYIKKNQNAVTRVYLHNETAGTDSATQYIGKVDSGDGIFGVYDDGYTAANETVFAGKTLVSNSGLGIVLNYSSSAGDVKITRGGDAATAWVMSGDMERTIPKQPCFLAYPSAVLTNVTGDATNYIVANNTEAFDQGSDYNTSTYIFTAPVSGRYLLSGTVFTYGLDADTYEKGRFEIITSNKNFKLHQSNFTSTVYDTGDKGIIASGCILADMDAGDTAHLKCYVSGGTKSVDISLNDTQFSGSLLC
jgi:hypothetical protein